MMTIRQSFVAAAVCAGLLGGNAWAQATLATAVEYTPTVGQSGKDVIWVPTPQSLVDRMLDMAELKPGEELVDLGSGDGRTTITAAKRGANARGIEFNPDMVALSKRAAQQEGVADRAVFEQADIFKSDFSNANVVTLFLLPDLNVRLRPTLLNMKPGTRVVSNSFNMGDWEPDETAQVTDGCAGFCTAYKWIVPAKVAGTWRVDGQNLVLKQKYQMLEGALGQGSHALPVSEGRLDGNRISFTIGEARYTGEVNGTRMEGTVDGQPWSATRAHK